MISLIEQKAVVPRWALIPVVAGLIFNMLLIAVGTANQKALYVKAGGQRLIFGTRAPIGGADACAYVCPGSGLYEKYYQYACAQHQTRRKKYPPETDVHVCRSKKATRELMKKLFPRQQGNNVFFGRRAE